MKLYKLVIGTALATVAAYGLMNIKSNANTAESTISAETKLRNANKIKIKEASVSFGKHYDIEVEGKKVAEVDGKSLKLWADKFTLKTIDGKVLASENENKRVFLQYNRSAEVFDSNNNTTGYISEERIKDLFSISYVFHFFDKDKNEIGSSKKLGKSALNSHKLYDNNGNADYDINKHLSQFVVAGGDRYTLTVLDKKSEIELEKAIFITCIEDAIADAHD